MVILCVISSVAHTKLTALIPIRKQNYRSSFHFLSLSLCVCLTLYLLTFLHILFSLLRCYTPEGMKAATSFSLLFALVSASFISEACFRFVMISGGSASNSWIFLSEYKLRTRRP